MRRAARVGLAGLAARTPRYRAAARGLAVFVYHDVDADPGGYSADASLAVTPELFRRQLGWISERFQIVDPDVLRPGGSVPEAAAIITFDDGFHSVLANALPVLEELSIPAIMFVNMGVAGGEVNASAAVGLAEAHGLLGRPAAERHRWSSVVPSVASEALAALDGAGRRSELLAHQGRYATIDELGQAADGGLLRLGSHLWNHWFGPSLTCAELEDALARNQGAVAELPGARPWLGFTYGVHTERLRRHARAAGAERLFTGGGVLNPDSASDVLHRIDLSDRIRSRTEFLGALAIRTAMDAATDEVADAVPCRCGGLPDRAT